MNSIFTIKNSVVSGIGAVAVAATFAGYGFCCHRHRESAEIQLEASDRNVATEWVPSDAELVRDNEGVGWVFGRMIGAEAPGSPDSSPFGGTPQRQWANRAKSIPRQ
jgi:hypothetical protein